MSRRTGALRMSLVRCEDFDVDMPLSEASESPGKDRETAADGAEKEEECKADATGSIKEANEEDVPEAIPEEMPPEKLPGAVFGPQEKEELPNAVARFPLRKFWSRSGRTTERTVLDPQRTEGRSSEASGREKPVEETSTDEGHHEAKKEEPPAKKKRSGASPPGLL